MIARLWMGCNINYCHIEQDLGLSPKLNKKGLSKKKNIKCPCNCVCWSFIRVIIKSKLKDTQGSLIDATV